MFVLSLIAPSLILGALMNDGAFVASGARQELISAIPSAPAAAGRREVGRELFHAGAAQAGLLWSGNPVR